MPAVAPAKRIYTRAYPHYQTVRSFHFAVQSLDHSYIGACQSTFSPPVPPVRAFWISTVSAAINRLAGWQTGGQADIIGQNRCIWNSEDRDQREQRAVWSWAKQCGTRGLGCALCLKALILYMHSLELGEAAQDEHYTSITKIILAL